MGPGLNWGVKESLRRYVDGVPDGTTTVTDGAARLDDGTFLFETAATADADHLRFRGDLRFSAHHGMMFVMVLDPHVVRAETGWELTVVDLAYWPDRERRMTFATLGEATRTEAGLEFADVLLTETGAEDFGGNYPAGTPLDAIRVRLG